MARWITRRQALLSGAATTGLLSYSSPALSQNVPLKNVWGEDFLMQWSAPENVNRDLTPGPSHIRLSCNAYNLRTPKEGESWGDLVRRVHDAGYTAVEASGSGWDYTIGDSAIREIKAACDEYDVEFYTLHVWANIIHPDLEERNRIHKLHADAIEMANRLGMKFILTHTGGRSGGMNKDRPHTLNFTKETWEMSVNAVKKILKDTAGSPVALAFEAVNSCNNNTPQSHVRLKQDVGNDRVKVTLDPANMLYAGTYFRTSELLNACFDLLGEDIMYAHAKDELWDDMMPHFEGVTLGEGGMDYELYLAHLSRLKYPRCLLIEHLPTDQYPPSKQFLEDTAARLGVTIYK